MRFSRRFSYSAGFLGLAFAMLFVSSSAHAYGIEMMFRAISDFTGYYGAGEDGAITVSGVPNGPTNPYVINSVATSLASNAAAAATSITVTSGTGFAAGDEILIIQMENADAGLMEFVSLASVSGTTLNLSAGLTHAYTAANKVQVLRVQHYTNVTINSGGFITVGAYSSGTTTGGVLAMKVSGTLTINNNGGSGTAGHISTGGGYTSFTGRGYAGGSSGSGSGLGGGTGNNGGTNTSPGSFERVQMGSGGGSSANTGGRGGGIVIIKAASIVLNGGIRADGDTPATGNAGGGAGGTILINVGSLTTSATCGTISASPGSGVGTGTAGGNGRLFINYNTTLSCQTATPAATSTYQKFYVR